jgi:hypothetical protein
MGKWINGEMEKKREISLAFALSAFHLIHLSVYPLSLELMTPSP